MKNCTLALLLALPLFGLGQPLIEKADSYFKKHEWQNAYAAYSEITRGNPYNGEYLNRMALSALQTGHPAEAWRAGRKALPTANDGALSLYIVGSACALMDSIPAAVKYIGKALSMGYEPSLTQSDPNLAALRDTPGFQALVAPQTPDLEDRVQQWRADLAFLRKEVETRHYNYLHDLTKAEWDSIGRRLYEGIPEMSDGEIIGGLMQLMAAVGDGHTLLYPPFQGPLAFKFLPLEFYLFGEDLYIRAATEDYKELVGAKVLTMGNMPVEKVLEAGGRFLGHDNGMQLRWILPIALSFSDFYALMGAYGTPDSLKLTLQGTKGTRFETTVTAGPVIRDPMGRFAPPNWVDMKGDGRALWTSDPENNYWYTFLEDKKVVYCQWNQVRDKDDQSVAAFAKELFGFINSNEVEALVLDIRLNNGGNNFLNDGFVHELLKCEKVNQHGKLFTIIGRRTFSAAMNLASELERHTETLFVGEPTGSKPNFFGEEDTFVLPYSQLAGSISSRYWQGGVTSGDQRIWIAPHLAADLRAEDYMEHRDPALEAIFEYLDACR